MLHERGITRQIEAIVVENVTTLVWIGTTVAVFRIATQETEVFHRYECLLVILVIDLSTLSNGSQHLSARFGTAIQVGN